MPTIERDGASIYYEVHGSASLPPLLLLAPGGLNSTIDFWGRMPLRPREAFAQEFRIIAMDQRNAGTRSSGPLDARDPWGMYAQDQLAVLDAVGVDQAQIIGCCIGCSFIFRLIEVAPQRVTSGVLMQPIGRDADNPGAFSSETWRAWGQNLIDHGARFSIEDVDAFGQTMFAPGSEPVFSVPREVLPTIQTPLLLLYGNDRAHPRTVSEVLDAILANHSTIERWRDDDVVPEVTDKIRTFLRSHQPAPAR